MDFYETDMGHSVGRGLWEVLHVFNTPTQDGTLLLFSPQKLNHFKYSQDRWHWKLPFLDEWQEANMLGKNMCKHCASPKFGQRKRYMSMSGGNWFVASGQHLSWISREHKWSWGEVDLGDGEMSQRDREGQWREGASLEEKFWLTGLSNAPVATSRP